MTLKSNENRAIRLKGHGIRVWSNERVFIAGMTGSGKTFLSHLMLYPVKRLILVDTKDELLDWNTENWSKEASRDLRSGDRPIRVRVVTPDQIFPAMESLWEGANGILYVDEATSIFNVQREPPQVVTDIFGRGRSRGVGAWTVTQRPARIPLQFMSEAQHYFCFYLNLLDDRKRMAEMMGAEVVTPPPDRYGFYYYSVLDRDLQYWPKVSLP